MSTDHRLHPHSWPSFWIGLLAAAFVVWGSPVSAVAQLSLQGASDLEGLVTSNGLALRWRDGSSTESGFQIEARRPKTNIFMPLAQVNANVTRYSRPFDEYPPGTVADFRVCGRNGSSTFGCSNVVRVANTLPAAPAGLAATAVVGPRVALTWMDRSSNETGFTVERAPGGTLNFVQIASTPAGVVTYNDVGVAPLTSFSYRVSAVNATGSTASNVATVTTLPAPPAAPQNLSIAGVLSSRIDLTWTDASSNETGFQIERRDAGSSDFSLHGSVVSNVTIFHDTSLPGSTAFAYRIRAVNSGGTSAPSNIVSATTLASAPPSAPVALTATPTGPTQVRLDWTPGTGAVEAYRIERTIPGSMTFVAIAQSLPPSLLPPFFANGLQPATSYTFRIQGSNNAGSSPYSNIATATTPQVPPPSAPTNLTAVAITASQVTLSWVASLGSSVSYTIERAVGTGAFAVAGTSVQPTFVVTGLQPDTAFSFRVRAQNAGGSSPYSNVLAVMTPTLPTNATVVASADNLLILNSEEAQDADTTFSSGVVSVGCNQLVEGIFVGFLCGSTALQFSGLQPHIVGRLIASARLRLVTFRPPEINSGATYAVRAFAGPWSPSTITFNNQPDAFLNPTASFSPPALVGQTVEVDVTAIVQQWASGTIPNNGLIVFDALETLPAGTVFRASDFESRESNSSLAPALAIVFGG